MSILAGFDVVIELAPAAVLEMIEGSLKIGGIYARPPFEFTLPVSTSSASGSMHVIVTSAEIGVNADDKITLTLGFGSASGTSLSVTSPIVDTVPLLAGSFAITAPVVLSPATVSATGGKQAPTVALAQSTVSVSFDTASKSKLAAALSGSQLTVSSLTTLLGTTAGAYLKSIPAIPVGKGLSVLPGKPGTLDPLRFESLEVHSVGTHALGLFGMLFPEKAKGNSKQKTGTALTTGHDVCVSISQDAFHRLEFCPALVKKFNVSDASALPPPCGSADGLDAEGATITSIGDSFGDGHVNIDGSIEKSTFCYDAHGTFHGEITFTATGTTLVPSLWLDDPDIDVDVEWYCGPTQFVYEVFGFLQKIIAGAIIQSVAGGIAQSAIDGITESGLAPAKIGTITGVSFDTAAVTPEALTLNGTATVALPLAEEAAVALNGSVTTSAAVEIGSGTRVVVVGFCPPTEFPYTEFAQTQTASYEVVPTLLALPLRILWSIIPGDGSAPIPLNDPDVPTSGEVAIPNQSVEYPFPSANGSIVTGVTLHIDSSATGLAIQLTNQPAEGNFMFTLRAQVEDSRSKLLVAETYVQFEGDTVAMGGGYSEFVSYCERKFGEWLNKHNQAADVIEPWVPVDFPAPETLAPYVRMLLNARSPQAATALAEAKFAHGKSFQRAITLPKTIDPTQPLHTAGAKTK